MTKFGTTGVNRADAIPPTTSMGQQHKGEFGKQMCGLQLAELVRCITAWAMLITKRIGQFVSKTEL